MTIAVDWDFKQQNKQNHNLATSTCDPFKHKIGSPILIVSICMGKSIRIQRVNHIDIAFVSN